MSEYKSRINIQVKNVPDWEKLFDIKMKEEWGLEKMKKKVFKVPYSKKQTEFIKAEDWSVDSKNLEDLVETVVKTMGYENCAVVADTTECSGIEQKCDSVVAIGRQYIIRISYPNGNTLKRVNVFNIYNYLKIIDIHLSIKDIEFLLQISEKFAYGDNNQTVIVIPNGRIMIRPEEFTGNFLLESVTIPESVKHIGEHAFANCKNLSEVIISDNVFNIDCGAFSNCESLGEIFIPNSVTNIGADAFYGCKNLNKINISNKVVILEKGVFSGCENLNEITIPYGVINIGDGAFEECKSLREVSIPDSVASIGDYAFWNCQSLNQITVWSNVTSIGYSAFDGCKNLTIRAFKGSYAERYALENEIPFEEI